MRTPPFERAPQAGRPGSSQFRTRRASRRRTLFTGMLSSGALTVDCVVTDFSTSGARVRIQSGAQIGGDLVLVHLREKLAFETRIAWRSEGALGLEFTRAHDLNQATTAEIKALRRFCVDFGPALIELGTRKD